MGARLKVGLFNDVHDHRHNSRASLFLWNRGVVLVAASCIIPVDSYHFVVLASNPVLDFMILHIVVYHATTSTLVLSLSPFSMFINARPGPVTPIPIDIAPLHVHVPSTYLFAAPVLTTRA